MRQLNSNHKRERERKKSSSHFRKLKNSQLIYFSDRNFSLISRRKMNEDVRLPSWRYQVFRGFGYASTMHCTRTLLSTGAKTNWITALTDGGTVKTREMRKRKKSLEINQSFKISEQQDEMTFTFHHTDSINCSLTVHLNIISLRYWRRNSIRSNTQETAHIWSLHSS